MDEREARLSDRELASVIRKASELQDRAVGPRPEEGTSLTMAREIAREIGVAPEFVDQAAAEVLDIGRSNLFFGAPPRQRSAASFQRSLTADETRVLIDRVESVLGRSGQIASSLGSTAWSAGEFSVKVSPRAGSTDVRIAGNRAPSVAPTVMIPLAVGLTAAGAIVDTLQPGSLEALAILGTGAGTGLAIARAVWAVSTRSFRAKVGRLQAEVHRFMNESPSPNPTSGPSAGPGDAGSAEGGTVPPTTADR